MKKKPLTPLAKYRSLSADYRKLKRAAQHVADNHWKGTIATGRNYDDDHNTLRNLLEGLK